jgi:TATA-binding protein-associated factor Taf7
VARRPTEQPPEAVKVKGFEDREEVCDGLSAPLTNVRATRFHKPVAEPDNLQAVEKALAVTISGGQPRQTDLHVEVRRLSLSRVVDAS